MVRVRFLSDDTPFRRGDEKDCSPAEAEKFVRQGVAETVSEPAARATRSRKAKNTKSVDQSELARFLRI